MVESSASMSYPNKVYWRPLGLSAVFCDLTRTMLRRNKINEKMQAHSRLNGEPVIHGFTQVCVLPVWLYHNAFEVPGLWIKFKWGLKHFHWHFVPQFKRCLLQTPSFIDHHQRADQNMGQPRQFNMSMRMAMTHCPTIFPSWTTFSILL